jgi:hypothetical protein
MFALDIRLFDRATVEIVPAAGTPGLAFEFEVL